MKMTLLLVRISQFYLMIIDSQTDVNRSIFEGPHCRAPSIHLINGDASSLPPAIDKEHLIKLYRQEQELKCQVTGSFYQTDLTRTQ